MIGSEIDYSPQLERLLQKGKGGGPKQRRILELNPNHSIFTKMFELYKQNNDNIIIREYAELLLGYALLAEGVDIPDPAKFNNQIINLMVKALDT